MKYRADIDGLRALAVIPVVLFHAGVQGFGGGFVGVDVFFVISGYLITTLITKEMAEDRFSLVTFYERRARRILPALFTVIAASGLFAYIYFLPEDFVGFGKSVAAAILFGSNFLFWHEAGYFAAPTELKPLIHTWSLAVEEQFYILFPLILIAVQRNLKAQWFRWLLPLFLASFILSVWGALHRPEAAFYLLPTRAWELLLGAMLAVSGSSFASGRVLREIAGALGLALITYGVITLSKHSVFPGYNALFPCVGAALVIWSGQQGDTLTNKFLATGPLVWGGLISYSLYLWHWPALVFASYVKMDDLTAPELIVLLLAMVGLSWLTWRYIEKPARAGVDWKGARLALAGVGSGVVLVAFGALAIASNGLPSRIAPEALQILAVAKAEQATEPQSVRQPGCPFLNEKRKSGRFCIKGAKGKEPSFVLVGDSHAGALSTGVFLAAQRLELAGYQYTDAGFRPIPGIIGTGPVFRARQTEQFIAFLRKHPSIKLVLLTGFWQIQATGGSFRHRNKLYRDDKYDGSGLAYNKKSFSRGLKKLLAMFPDRKFALIEDVPSGRQLSVKFAARLVHIRGAQSFDQDSFGMSRKDYQAQINTYRHILRSAAKADNGFVVTLIDVLCNRLFCSGFLDGKLLYRNADHLSKAGSALFVDKFSKKIMHDF